MKSWWYFMILYWIKISSAEITVCNKIASLDDEPESLSKDHNQSLIFIENISEKGQKGENGKKGEKGEKGAKGDNCQINQTEINHLRHQIKDIKEMTNKNFTKLNKDLDELKNLQGQALTRKSGAYSCLQLNEKGVNESGYYILDVNGSGVSYKTHCDMTTAGGGWTLVASINDNDVTLQCESADTWFSCDKIQANDPFASRNWENKNIFGDIDLATFRDYKNPGYFSIQAKDIMVRHIQNHKNLNTEKEGVILQYHSESKFLTNYGGNLFNLYRKNFSLNAKIPENFDPDLQVVFNALSARANEIVSHIPNFYNYVYGGSSYQLNDGGSNMFNDYGMRLLTEGDLSEYKRMLTCSK